MKNALRSDIIDRITTASSFKRSKTLTDEYSYESDDISEAEGEELRSKRSAGDPRQLRLGVGMEGDHDKLRKVSTRKHKGKVGTTHLFANSSVYRAEEEIEYAKKALSK